MHQVLLSTCAKRRLPFEELLKSNSKKGSKSFRIAIKPSFELPFSLEKES